MRLLLVVTGGLLGAPARYLLDSSLSRVGGRELPWGTIAVNVLGCALLGVMAGLSVGGLPYALAGTGFCGAFTTFSTFTWETFALFEDGHTRVAALNLVATLLLGLGAAAVGYVLA